MSLFSGLFSNKSKTSNALFESSGKFHAEPLPLPALTLPPPGAPAPVLASATAEPAAKEQSVKLKKRKQPDAATVAKHAAVQAEAAAATGTKSSKRSKAAGSTDGAAAAASAPAAKKARAGQQHQEAQAQSSADAGTGKLEKKKKKVKPSKDQQKAGDEGTQAAAAAAATSTVAAAAEQQGKGGKKTHDKEKTGKQPCERAAAKQRAQAQEQEQSGAGEGTDEEAGQGQPQQEQQPRGDATPRTLYVGNLHPTVKRKAIVKLFSKYGEVESVRLRSVPVKADAKMPHKAAVLSGNIDTSRPCSAYVVFAEEASARAALALNMTEFDGLHLRVDRAAPPKQPPQAKAKKGDRDSASAVGADDNGAGVFDPVRTLFVGNLPLDAQEEDLVTLFNATGAVEGVRIPRDRMTSQGRGVGFVLFKSAPEARAALSLEGQTLKGRELRITRASRSAAGGTAGGKAQAWQQGVRTGTGKKAGLGGVSGGVHKNGGSGSKKGARPVLGKRKAGGKRPAVVARKQQQRLKQQHVKKRS